MIEHQAQTGGAAHAATWEAKATRSRRRFKSEPEPNEWTEREGKENPIRSGHSRDAQDLLPIGQHRIPTFRGIEPAQGRSSRAAGLMTAGVTVQRIGEIRSVRR